MEQRRRTTRLGGLVLLVFAVAFCCLAAGRMAEADSASDYIITDYHVDMSVTEGNVYHITEEIHTYFKLPRHGIYRVIPMVNEVVRQDGSRSVVRAKIKNLRCDGDKYSVERDGDDCRIQIGDKDVTITGDKTYTIHYDYYMGADVLSGGDEFYYNIIGQNWSTTIQNVSFRVKMPKEFDEKKLGFSYGSYGSDHTDGITYMMEDAYTFSGELDSSIILMPQEGLTVRLTLPEGYFKVVEESYIWESVSGVLAVLTIVLGFVLWWKFGKDDPVVETVEFHPPYRLNPVQIGYAYRGHTSSKDIVSLVVYLAQKGYLRIEENGKKDFKLVQVKPYDGANTIERTFLGGLFSKKNAVTQKDLEDSFYKTIADITTKVDTKDEKRKLFYSSSLNKGWIITLMSISAFIMGMLPRAQEYYLDAFQGALVCGVMAAVFAVIHWLVMGAQSLAGGISGALIGIGLCVAGVFFGMRWMNMPLYLLLTITSATTMFFVNYMEKRTPYGNDLLGKIRGFRNFLLTAEKERLEMLVMDEPQYFYEILPYTYVLGISDKWMKKFETIAMSAPRWYSGTDTASTFQMMHFCHFMDRTMKQATTAMVSSPSSSGGGFSGGGFSGGGSGGGGGGSW